MSRQKGDIMREVLISIQPKWCKLICSGEKTVEVRKNRPKCEVPFKVYIYETLGKTKWCNTCKDPCERPYPNCACHEGWGKVIGEFVCDRVIGTCSWRLKGETGLCAKRTEEETNLPNNACLTLEEIEKYAGSRGRGIYGWHISDLVIYDKPRELGEFYVWKKCNSCRDTGYESTACCYDEDCRVPVPIKRPFQSWGYVYEKEN